MYTTIFTLSYQACRNLFVTQLLKVKPILQYKPSCCLTSDALYRPYSIYTWIDPNTDP